MDSFLNSTPNNMGATNSPPRGRMYRPGSFFSLTGSFYKPQFADLFSIPKNEPLMTPCEDGVLEPSLLQEEVKVEDVQMESTAKSTDSTHNATFTKSMEDAKPLVEGKASPESNETSTEECEEA